MNRIVSKTVLFFFVWYSFCCILVDKKYFYIMNEQQFEQISSLRKVIVDDNGYAFLTLNREGNNLKAEGEDYTIDLDQFETKSKTQWNIFGDICEKIIKDTYPAHKFDYENAVEHKRKIVFSYLINDHQASMECTMNVKKILGLLYIL